MNPVTIDIYADLVCPWCYIGEARLEQALTSLPDAHVTRRWRPFQLRPEMPVGGLPWRAFAADKFGGWQQAEAAFAQVTAVGAAAGLSFHFERVSHAPNTVDAHRLVLLAAEQGKGVETAKTLFRAYFEDGVNVGERAALVSLAARVRLDEATVQADLESNRHKDTVAQSQQQAQRLAISGVPFFVLDGRYGVSGAQSVEVFRHALEVASSHTTDNPQLIRRHA